MSTGIKCTPSSLRHRESEEIVVMLVHHPDIRIPHILQRETFT